jgi:DNA-binding response OmpR family regulator
MKILAVEDSRLLRVGIERSLTKEGHKVIGVADGRKALLIARTELPAVILLDMMLPGMDGTSVLRQLKQDASTAHIPVIVLSGLSQMNEAKLREAGATAYIEKSSLDLDKLADRLLAIVANPPGISGEHVGARAQQPQAITARKTNQGLTKAGSAGGASEDSPC